MTTTDSTRSTEDIQELLKLATKQKVQESHDEAIETLKHAVTLMEDSPLSYSYESYTKIISYFQIAGRYNEAEDYAETVLIPAIKRAVARGMSQRAGETIAMHQFQYMAAVCDKLALIAQREGKSRDELRFRELQRHCRQRQEEFKPLSEKAEQENDFQAMLGVWGSNFDEWPEKTRKRYAARIEREINYSKRFL